MRKNTLSYFLPILVALACSSCAGEQRDQTGPVVTDIIASNNVIVISDCTSASVTISAQVADNSDISKVNLWFHAGSGMPYQFVGMTLKNSRYEGVINGESLLGQEYGPLEFYITAEDVFGNVSRSPTDTSIQFLPCVNN